MRTAALTLALILTTAPGRAGELPADFTRFYSNATGNQWSFQNLFRHEPYPDDAARRARAASEQDQILRALGEYLGGRMGLSGDELGAFTSKLLDMVPRYGPDGPEPGRDTRIFSLAALAWRAGRPPNFDSLPSDHPLRLLNWPPARSGPDDFREKFRSDFAEFQQSQGHPPEQAQTAAVTADNFFAGGFLTYLAGNLLHVSDGHPQIMENGLAAFALLRDAFRERPHLPNGSTHAAAPLPATPNRTATFDFASACRGRGPGCRYYWGSGSDHWKLFDAEGRQVGTVWRHSGNGLTFMNFDPTGIQRGEDGEERWSNVYYYRTGSDDPHVRPSGTTHNLAQGGFTWRDIGVRRIREWGPDGRRRNQDYVVSITGYTQEGEPIYGDSAGRRFTLVASDGGGPNVFDRRPYTHPSHPTTIATTGGIPERVSSSSALPEGLRQRSVQGSADLTLITDARGLSYLYRQRSGGLERVSPLPVVPPRNSSETASFTTLSVESAVSPVAGTQTPTQLMPIYVDGSMGPYYLSAAGQCFETRWRQNPDGNPGDRISYRIQRPQGCADLHLLNPIRA
jgi:hypothetical protein